MEKQSISDFGEEKNKRKQEMVQYYSNFSNAVFEFHHPYSGLILCPAIRGSIKKHFVISQVSWLTKP